MRARRSRLNDVMVRPAALLVVLAASVAAAQTVYKWEDADGVHYTDDLATVPPNAKPIATVGAPTSVVPASPVAPKPPTPAAAAVVAPKPATTGPGMPSDVEQHWRGQFRAAHAKIRELEDEIASDSKKVEQLNGLPVNQQFSCTNGVIPSHVVGLPSNTPGTPGTLIVGPNGTTVLVPQGCVPYVNPELEKVRDRLERNRKALVRANSDLDDLERRASNDAVPRAWRR